MPEKLRPAGDYGLLKASTLKVNDDMKYPKHQMPTYILTRQYMCRIYSIPDFILFTNVNIGIPVSKQHL